MQQRAGGRVPASVHRTPAPPVELSGAPVKNNIQFQIGVLWFKVSAVTCGPSDRING